MKTTCLTWLFALFICFAVSSQSDCNRYYPMVEGASFQYTHYGKKGKTVGTTSYTISEVSSDGDATNATMAIEFKDAKAKDVFTTDYKFSCTKDKVIIDYQSLIPNEMLEGYKDMEMEITGTDIELPNNLSVGQELADAHVMIKIDMGGMSMKMNVDQENRKVEKQETVTTPAGTFDCLVVYSETKSKVMMTKQSFPTRIWLADGIGMVKQETYNKSGKMTDSMLLTAHSE
ncbi:MAG: hypothetical protein AAGL29_05080 [Bacteroidota bacterium]